MRVLVCGGRNYGVSLGERECLYGALDQAAPTVVIEGGAQGADARAREWARHRRVPNETFTAEWGKYGKRAGPIRNQKMLDAGKPDLVLAFPGGYGTADMVAKAKAAGVRVVEYTAPAMGSEHG
jgi:hypothetical protein